MKNYAIIVLLILVVALATCLLTKAQSATAYSYTGGGPVSTCAAKLATDPAAMCQGTDDTVFHLAGVAGYTVSISALSKLGAGGVTSVQVGTGTPMTGAVVLPNIPSTATTTVTSTAVTTIK